MTPQGAQNPPKIAKNRSQNDVFFLDAVFHRFISDLDRFWKGPTLKNLRFSSENTGFSKIEIFAPGADFDQFWVDLGSYFGPKTLQTRLRDAIEKSTVFIYFLSIFS